MTSNAIRYSGSPLKYSFDEWKHRKGMLSVEIGADGRVDTEFLPLTPKHDLLVIEDVMENVLNRIPTMDYVAVRLLNREQILNARVKLEKLFPNLLSIEKIGMMQQGSALGNGEIKKLEGTSILDQFKDFYKYQTNEALDEEEEAALVECLREMREEDQR